MTFYIAGPMTGYPLLNFPAFDKAAKHLRSYHFDVVSPAEIDRANGVDPETAVITEEKYRELLERDLGELRKCEGIYLLRGWERSPGARRELLEAISLRLVIQLEA